MPREQLFADDYEFTLGNGVRDWSTVDGMFSSAPVEGENLRLPGRDGEMYVQKRLGASSFVVRMWMGAATRDAAQKDWENLLRAVVKRHRLVRWTRTLPDGSSRTALGEVIGKVDPTPIGQYGFRAQIEVSVPSGKWQDTGLRDTGKVTINPAGITGPINAVVYFPNLAGGSASYTDLQVDVAGPISAFKVSAFQSGMTQIGSPWFRYDTSLASAATVLTVESGPDVVTAPDLSKFHYRGPYLFELGAMDDTELHPWVRVEATSCSSTATIRLYGRRSFLM